MQVYDISQELTGCAVYPGDRAPRAQRVRDMDRGELYNLTDLSLCTHNGTHVDAPCHFIREGGGVDAIPLESCVGPCRVICHEGDFTAAHVAALGTLSPRLLIRGRATVTAEAARALVDGGVRLVGNESQTVGPEDAPMQVHRILLSARVVLLEGVRLSHVEPGDYFLSAAPLNIAGSDGAPCRAVLVSFDRGETP